MDREILQAIRKDAQEVSNQDSHTVSEIEASDLIEIIDLALKGLDEKPPAPVCAHCGTEFDRTNGPQKYCSDDCAKDAKRKNDAEYRAKNREKRNEYNRKYREQKKADFETYLNGSTPPKDMGGK